MRRRLIPAQCPHCLHTGYYPRDTYLVKGNPEDFLQRRYFLQRCSSCHQEFEMAHPLYYRDGSGKFAILLSHASHMMPDERDRISLQVSSPAAFYKAFAILHFSLDIARASALWKQLEQKQNKPLWLQDVDAANRILWFFDEQGHCMGVKDNSNLISH